MTPLIFALALTLPSGPPPPTPIEFYMPGVEIDPPVLVPVVKLAPPIQPSAAPVIVPTPSAVAVVPKKGPFFGVDCRGQKWKGPDEMYLKAFLDGRNSVLKTQPIQTPPLYYAPPMTFQGFTGGIPCFT